MMEERQRKPGSVRLTEEQYREMEQLGLDNESAYVKYKLNGAQQHLQVLRDEQNELGQENTETTPFATPKTGMAISDLEDRLAIQRLSLENEQLKSKLNELSRSKEEALDGIHGQVTALLRDELLQRDFEALKKETAARQKEIEKLEQALAQSKGRIEEKESEIRELVKKLGLVELGKALLPGAVNGLARQFPREMKGLVQTLGELSGEDFPQLPSADQLNEEQRHLLNVVEYFRELFSDEQFDQVVQLVSRLGEQLKKDDSIIGKMSYYLDRVTRVKAAQQPSNENPQNEAM